MSAKNTRPFKDLDNDHTVIFQVGNNKLKETIPSDIPENIRYIIEQC
jgi:hypothetical protein